MGQFARGDKNVNVENSGSGTTINVNIGTETIELIPAHKNTYKVTRLLDILNPYSCAISYIGGEAYFTTLQNWIEKPDSISITYIAGPAGSGKTRLSLELCKEAENRGWKCGHINEEEIYRVINTNRFEVEDFNSLIIIDDACTYTRHLTKFLRLIKSYKTSENQKIRVLLLDRYANARQGWLKEINESPLWSHHYHEDLIDSEYSLSLQGISSTDNRENIFKEALQSAIQLYCIEYSDIHLLAAKALKMSNASFPLEIIALSLSVIQFRDENLSFEKKSVMQRIAKREVELIAKHAESNGVEGDLAKHIALCAMLVNGIPENIAVDLIDNEINNFGFNKSTSTRKLINTLNHHLPSSSKNTINSIKPDALAETIIKNELEKLSYNTVLLLIERLFNYKQNDLYSTLIRVLQSHPESDQIDKILKNIIEKTQDPAELAHYFFFIPEHTSRLREMRLSAIKKLICILGPLNSTEHSNQSKIKAQLAIAKIEYAKLLSTPHPNSIAVNYFTEGLEELVNIQDPEPELKSYIAFTINQAALNLDTGSDNFGIDLAKQCVAKHKSETLSNDYNKYYLANSLNILAVALTRNQEYDDALNSVNECIATFEELRDSHEDENISASNGIAVALYNKANIQLRLHGYDEALRSAAASVEIRRSLAIVGYDAHIHLLARSLRKKAEIEIKIADYENSVYSCKEAIAIYKTLEEHQPGIFGYELTDTLSVCAICHSETGNYIASIQLIDEAILLTSQITNNGYDALVIGNLYHNRGNGYRMLSNFDKALESFNNALIFYERELVRTSSPITRRQIADTHASIGMTYDSNGEIQQALEYLSRGIEIYRNLAAINPQPCARMTIYLSTISLIYAKTGRRQEARAYISDTKRTISLIRSVIAEEADEFHTAKNLMRESELLLFKNNPYILMK